MDDGMAPVRRDENGRFAPGGTGRPHGTRNRVSRRVANAILADFEANRDEVLPRLRRWFLPQYVSLIGRLLPRDTEADAAAMDAAQTARLIEAARLAFARIDAGEGTLADLEAALAGEAPVAAPPPPGTDIIGDYR